VPSPVASAVSHWGADPFTRGAYSFVRMGSLPEDAKALAQSVSNVLFFAGEAASYTRPGASSPSSLLRFYACCVV
jgi:hypothetical protein